MVIRVDIDSTICITNGTDYENALPIYENIKKINELYESGNTIIYWSSRGVCSGLDYTKLTEQQFINWKVKYNKIELNKPYYDVFIDDKVINTKEYFNGVY